MLQTYIMCDVPVRLRHEYGWEYCGCAAHMLRMDVWTVGWMGSYGDGVIDARLADYRRLRRA